MARIFMPWIIKHPKTIPTMLRLAKAYKKSRRIRNEELFKNELKVPPFLIISITSRCNLKCTGCYAAATGTVCESNKGKSLKIEQWKKIIEESTELGVFGFVIAGGEPFVVQDLLDLSQEFKDRLFIIFTNGTILDEQKLEKLKRLKNTIVVVSIEGDQYLTDLRRGNGVYDKALEAIKQLDETGIINGVSVTITRKNLHYWMNPENIDHLIDEGVRIGFILEYIPVNNDIELMLTNEESKEFRKQILNYRETKNIFLVHSPGDEEYMGGCVSAGRGFAHINPSGDLTPCPVSDLATHNLTKSTLREGLKSPLFEVIRKSEHLLETDDSPCALFSHPNEVNELAKKVKAYKTSA